MNGGAATDPAATHGLWADLHQPGVAPEQSDFVVIGIPYDGAASARTGTSLGPQRIRFWSQHTTPYTEDRTRLHGLRICDLGNIEVRQQAADFEVIRAKISSLSRTPIVLGGDHSVTIPVFQGQLDRFRNRSMGVLWLDAHPDLCDEFTGSRLSHACVLRRGLESGLKPENICMVGLRSWEEQEIDLIESSGLHVYTAADVAAHGMTAIGAEVHRVLSSCEAVHISLDIDCLDPGFAPGTGIPDSGGLTPREVITLIKSLRGLPLVGLDVVEVSPPLDPSEATVFAALKFIMEFIGLAADAKRGNNPRR